MDKIATLKMKRAQLTLASAERMFECVQLTRDAISENLSKLVINEYICTIRQVVRLVINRKSLCCWCQMAEIEAYSMT